MNNQSPAGSGTDTAAVSAAVLAVAFVTFIDPGPWGPTDLILGLTVLAILFGYSGPKERTRGRTAGYASIVSFSLLIPIGYALEAFRGKALEPDGVWEDVVGGYVSLVTPTDMLIQWIILCFIVYTADRMYQRRRIS